MFRWAYWRASGCTRGAVRWMALGAAIATGIPVLAQMPVFTGPGPVRMVNADMAILETQDVRKDLACTVTPGKATLGFDLRFHSGYEVTVPLKDLAGNENQLT